MENILGLKLGIGGLDESMSEQEIKRTLAQSFKAIPNMIGINNPALPLPGNPGMSDFLYAMLNKEPNWQRNRC